MSKVTLRGLTINKDKLVKLAEWRNHPDVRGVLLTSYVSHEDFEQQKEWANSSIRSESNHFYFIEPVEPIVPVHYHLVGYCGLLHLRMIPRTAEVSILIAPNFMQQGYGTDAVKDLLDIAFLEFNLNCVYVECYTNSERWEFFKGLGFKFEGQLRERKYWKGKYYDSIMGSMLRKDWLK